MPEGTSSESTYLALDLGAESGRAIAGRLRSGVLTIEELHRFPNEPLSLSGTLRWNVEKLWSEIRCALGKASDLSLDGIAVDTWGVDYGLLKLSGELVHNPYHYRDDRTAGMMDEVFRVLPPEEIYAATGIQFMPINTLYQLFAEKRHQPQKLAEAHRLLLMPDLFHYWMTGNAVCEFTNASTTQLVDPHTRSWCAAVLEKLDLPARLFAPLVEPGTNIGSILPDVAPALNGTPVIAPASHDTGSAVAAISARGNTAFLSSGTWSLLGIELDRPVVTDEARRLNFTNEGGVCGTTRLLKNVMGLWLLQGCRKSWSQDGAALEYHELIRLAAEHKPFQHLFDPDHDGFFRPADMPAAIARFCQNTGQAAPDGPGAFVRAVLESLAMKYRRVLLDLERLTGQEIEQVRVIGGGCRNALLNQLTADATGKRVLAGPVEATALGNIAVQMLATGATTSLAESRRLIESSFPVEVFEPRNTPSWDKHAERFNQYCEVRHA
jgi:rhamnulokinase